MRQMLYVFVLAIATSGTVAANAATHHKHKHSRRFPQASSQPYALPYALHQRPQVGPVWSGPNQCWTDEGYGRYAPCDGGGKAM